MKYQNKNKIEQQIKKIKIVFLEEKRQGLGIFSTQTSLKLNNLFQRQGLINNYEKKVNYEN